ncbi:PREDICTED: cytochrome b561 domain-containing protein 2-like isoform X1 [Eufriesea mexicana]|uniref:cytochrome b561 domain-containing protein 2-like isoform X1 n=1 Tax=Eufriesea mexicana TaxID=516756 RepID=UPI00083C2271|nr:PREDICTED: cytochrome b561 domain-containing protein 2-like isoform X1 [Eufriesea mexicana]
MTRIIYYSTSIKLDSFRRKDNSDHKMIDQPAGKGPPSAIMLVFSVLTHVLLLAPVIYILVLAFNSYSFFSWHPICMSVGVGLLITEAIFSVSGEAYLGWKVSRFNRVTIHWILHMVGLALVLVGLIIIVVNKINNNKEHFATPHAILGLVSIILAFLTAAFGIVTKNSRWLYPRFRPVLLKIVHAFGGILVTILLLATLITGTYTRWWPGGDTGRSLTFTAFFIAGFFILLKPVLGAVSRSKVVFGPPPATT